YKMKINATCFLLPLPLK
ncbi:unnamed protein product, partial [Callosobruchus maculatus]